MSRKTVLFISLIIVSSAITLFLKFNSPDIILIQVENCLPDITIESIYLNTDTVDFLNNNLEPAGMVELSIPKNTTSIRAVDTEGGLYLSEFITTDSTEKPLVQLTMENRSLFEQTIESGGEYWAGSGTGTIKITNSLVSRDIYWINIYNSDESTENADDMLGSFILFPTKTLNVRVPPGSYFLLAEDDSADEYTCASVDISSNQINYCWEVTRDFLRNQQDNLTSTSPGLIVTNALGSWIIAGVYHRNSTDSNWSTNNLGSSAIEVKEQFSIPLEPGSYDIMVEDEDGDTYTFTNITIENEPHTINVRMSHLDRYIP